MKRLTEPGFQWTESSIFREIDRWSLAQCLNRLSEYEDTGLDPEEVMDLKKRDATAVAMTQGNSERILFHCPVCGHIYMIAYSDGLVVGEIPEFCQDCGQRLKKGMENEIHSFMEKMKRRTASVNRKER